MKYRITLRISQSMWDDIALAMAEELETNRNRMIERILVEHFTRRKIRREAQILASKGEDHRSAEKCAPQYRR